MSDEGDPAGYFSSYNDMSVHELMLKDRPRTLAYRSFFETYRHLIKDKVVMDVGAGTGILSLFAASAGAKKVYAVEASGMASLCKEIVEESKMEEIIEVVHGAVEDIQLDTKVDVIVSEWMGFYLLHESMLDSVIVARDRFLAPGGIMAPSHATIYFAPVDMSEHFQDRADEWSNIYGYDFSPIASVLNMSEVSQPLIKCLSPDVLRSEPQELLKIDLKTVKVDDVQSFMTKLEFSISEDTRVHGFACWFDTSFSVYEESEGEAGGGSDSVSSKTSSGGSLPLSSGVNEKGDGIRCQQGMSLSVGDQMRHADSGCEKTKAGDGCSQTATDSGKTSSSKSTEPRTTNVVLKTGPRDPPTHWKQTVIFLPHTVMFGAGTEICCRVTMAQDVTSNKRHYNITVALSDEAGDDEEDYAGYFGGGGGEECSTDEDEGEEEEEEEKDCPVPCYCGSDRCKLLAALVEKYDAEHDQLGDEAEQVEIKAEVEAAQQLNEDIEREGWPMDTSGSDTSAANPH